MKIEHVAIWTKDIEKLRDFYVTYFEGVAGDKYINHKNNLNHILLNSIQEQDLKLCRCQQFLQI